MFVLPSPSASCPPTTYVEALILMWWCLLKAEPVGGNHLDNRALINGIRNFATIWGWLRRGVVGERASSSPSILPSEVPNMPMSAAPEEGPHRSPVRSHSDPRLPTSRTVKNNHLSLLNHTQWGLVRVTRTKADKLPVWEPGGGLTGSSIYEIVSGNIFHFPWLALTWK